MSIGLLHVYVRRGIAYVPCLAQTTAGFYLEVNPVLTASLSVPGDLERTLARAVAHEHTSVPTPDRHARRLSVLALAANVKSASAFDRVARMFSIELADGVPTIRPGIKVHGGWIYGEAVLITSHLRPVLELFPDAVATAIRIQLDQMNGR